MNMDQISDMNDDCDYNYPEIVKSDKFRFTQKT